MRRYNRDFEGIEIEWSPALFGYMSVPVFIVGVIFFSFQFEEYIPEKPIVSALIIILKILGLIMIALGFIWFWFAEQFYLYFFV